MTLLHFPLMLLLAYGQDRNWNFSNYNKVLPSDGEHPGDASQYTKFRRNAIRYFTGGKRVMWKVRIWFGNLNGRNYRVCIGLRKPAGDEDDDDGHQSKPMFDLRDDDEIKEVTL